MVKTPVLDKEGRKTLKTPKIFKKEFFVNDYKKMQAKYGGNLYTLEHPADGEQRDTIVPEKISDNISNNKSNST